MRSNYKQLGQYIESFDFRNKNRSEQLGLDAIKGISSIYKSFIKTKANLVGVSPGNYKVVKPNQFGFNPNTARMGDKIPIALNSGKNDILVSSIYPTFRIIDENELLPEYLMMWFRRSEFDRYARFKSHGSAREIFDFEEMRGVELPVPSIEKQRAIVSEYNTIVNRIKLNEQLNQKLEETAQELYKHWFVDFEFPDENGQPYKSSGGEMVYNEKLDQEIPLGWRTNGLGELIESHSRRHDFVKDELIFFNTSDILNGDFLHSNYSDVAGMPGQAKKSIRKNDILYSEIRPVNRRFALVRIDAEDYVVSTKLMVLRVIDSKINHLRIYQFLTYPKFINKLQRAAEGRSGTFPQITFEEHLESYPFLIGSEDIESRFLKFLTATCAQFFSRRDENRILVQMKNILLSQMSKVKPLKTEQVI